MAKILECVPNISEGRDEKIIEAVLDEVRSTPGVILLDYSSDESHNRTVITFLGEPTQVAIAAIKVAEMAVKLIDLTKHEGEHPRMGAVDVIPFIPIKDMSMAEAIEISKEVGKAIYEKAQLPVFLYEESASSPDRQNLARIRKGQFEAMATKIKEALWAPDYGEPAIHKTAGVVAVGARMPLVAFNINLSTSDIKIANDIAKIIRRSGGGFNAVKGIGVMLEERNIAQVSINMTDFNQTPLYRVLETVRMEAKRHGVTVVGCEIIGLAPMNALIDSAEYYLQLEHFDSRKQILENHVIG